MHQRRRRSLDDDKSDGCPLRPVRSGKTPHILAQRYHIHTVLTCHQPGQVNLSQSTGINESIIVAKRHDGPKPDTRFINLDRMPADDVEVDDLHQCLRDCANGVIANGWGEVSHWPAERIAAGDWTPAIWRSPELAAAAARFANDDNLVALPRAWQVGRELTQSFERGQAITPGSFPVTRIGWRRRANSASRATPTPIGCPKCATRAYGSPTVVLSP